MPLRMLCGIAFCGPSENRCLVCDQTNAANNKRFPMVRDSSNFSIWLREACGFVSCDLKKISVVVPVVILSPLDEETRAGGAYSMASKGRYEPWSFGCHTAGKTIRNRLRASVFIRVLSRDAETLEVTAFSEITDDSGQQLYVQIRFNRQ
jgi:hypothetical protein